MNQTNQNNYTEWYPHTIEPLQIGVYQIEDEFGISEWAIYDVDNWYKLGKLSETELYRKYIPFNSYSSLPIMDSVWYKWRGLTEEGFACVVKEQENLLDKERNSSLYSKFIKWIKGNK